MVTWKWNGEALPPDASLESVLHHGRHWLRIQSLQLTHSGTYSCYGRDKPWNFFVAHASVKVLRGKLHQQIIEFNLFLYVQIFFLFKH